MQYKITIPEPCRQNWDTMLPDATGRYCNSCQKSVIDFTAKTDEEIQQFFINNFSQPVCARFKNTQIHRIVIDLPQNIFSIRMPTWMRFLVACLIIFGISIFPFEATVAGKRPSKISFSQDSAVAVKTDKKPRILKKKKRRKSKKLDFKDIIWTTMGYMPTPGPPINTSLLDTAFPSNLIAGTQIGLSDKPLSQREHPAPIPFMPGKFILPSVLMFRTKKINLYMD